MDSSRETKTLTNTTDDKPGRATTTVGGSVAGAGCLIAIAPIPLTFIGCAAAGNPGGCGDMAMLVFVTAPVGIVVAFVGLIVGVVGAAAKRPHDDIVAKPSQTPTPTPVASHSPKDAPTKASSGIGRLSWRTVATIARILFVTLFIATTAVSVVNALNYLSLDYMPGLPQLFAVLAASPIVIAAWSLWQSRKIDPASDTQPSRAALARLIRVQGFIALAGAIWTPLLLGIDGFSGILTGGMDPSATPIVSWEYVVGIAPMLMGIFAYIILAILRGLYKTRK